MPPRSSADDAELPVREGYARWAPLYDGDGNPLTALEGPAVQSLFGPLSGLCVIDIGCGTGRHTEALAPGMPATLLAVDLSPEMIEIARRKSLGPSVHFARMDFPRSTPFREAAFDLAVLGLIVEHIEALDSVFAELRRILKTNGRCIVSVLHPDRTAEGQRARFIDPLTGVRRSIETHHRTVGQYLDAASSAGLVLERERSLEVTPILAERLPRALPYVGRKLGWVASWSRSKTD